MKPVSVPGDETTSTVLDVRDRSETVVLDLEDVFGRIEGLQKAG